MTTRPLDRSLRADRERGSLTLELAVIAPALIALIGLLVVAGRVSIAHTTIDHVADEAARAASLARGPAGARRDARNAANDELGAQGLQCAELNVSVNVDGFSAPLGQAATTAVTVRCRVRLRDVVLPGLPDTITITGDAISPIDTNRERS